jgi:hypothetical protein
MADGGSVAESVARRYAVLRQHLDERQRRLLLGTGAAQLGGGGIKAVAEAAGCIRTRWLVVCARSQPSSLKGRGCVPVEAGSCRATPASADAGRMVAP